MTTVIVKNSRFISHSPVNIPKGTVEAERVLVQLDKSWDGLTVRIHWANKASGAEVVSLLEQDKPNSIPWELLSDPGELRMGLVGLDGETTVKPTIWLCYGYVVEGVDPASGADPKPPTPSWEQQMVGQAEAAAASAKAAQEAAEMAGPYAQAAKASAESAKEDQVAAAAYAQAAGQSQAAAAQAQVSAQGNATAAQQAKAAAQQAAQEAQIAQESVAQSAQDAATDAQRAETASQVAQDAAVRAEAVDAYPRQVANDRFALALKTDTGRGTSHEIYPDAGSNVVVTAWGYTEQEGVGDPSPENVRPIKVGGNELYKIVLTGSESSWTETVDSTGGYKRFGLSIAPKIASGGVCNYYKPTTTGNKFLTDKTMYLTYTNKLIFRDDDFSGIEEFKSHLANLNENGNPLTVWAFPNSTSTAQTDGIYIPNVLSNDVYNLRIYGCKGTALPLSEPLCDGDYVTSNKDGQCVEVHNAIYLEVDSSWIPKEVYKTTISGDYMAFGIYQSNVGVDPGLFPTQPLNVVCSHARFGPTYAAQKRSLFYSNSQEGIPPNVFSFRLPMALMVPYGYDYENPSTIKTSFPAYAQAQKEAGTPIQIVLTITRPTPITRTHAPVPLIAKPDGTGKVTVSGEKEVSAVYNKSIKRAFEEINAAILKLGGSQNV